MMNPIGKRLSQNHQELAALLERLSQATEPLDREALAATWPDLAARLIRHMEAEEHYLLPLVAASHPAEVNRTLLEHTQIRDLIAELSVAVEQHVVRNDEIQALIELLQAHAKHEDQQFYRLAGDKASVAVEHSVLATLKAVRRPNRLSMGSGKLIANLPREANRGFGSTLR